MSKQDIHFITYGNHVFKKAKERLLKEAEEFSEFKTITGYGPEDLPSEFTDKFNYILSLSRGAGYWLWRPSILLNKLNKINDGEFIIFLDAGCKLNSLGKGRFNEYIDLLNKSDYGIMSFQMSGNTGPGGFECEKSWTTSQVFDYFNISRNSEYANTGQYLGGILVIKKNEHSLKLINLMVKAVNDNPLMFTDYYNRNQHPEFKDHRHEQSVFSLLRKIHGSVVIDGDESWMMPFGEGESLKYPFWATRSKE